MVAADREHSPAAQEIEVAVALGVEQILAAPGPEAHVEADGFEQPHHLLVEMLGMQRIALLLAFDEQRRGVQGHAILPAAGYRRRPTELEPGRDGCAIFPSG